MSLQSDFRSRGYSICSVHNISNKKEQSKRIRFYFSIPLASSNDEFDRNIFRMSYERICDILWGFMPRFQNTITMSQRFWWWYFMIRAKAQCILNVLLLKVLTITSI